MHPSAVFSLTKYMKMESGLDPLAASNKFLIWHLLLHKYTFILFPPAETYLFYIILKVKLPESILIRKGKDKQQSSDPNEGCKNSCFLCLPCCRLQLLKQTQALGISRLFWEQLVHLQLKPGKICCATQNALLKPKQDSVWLYRLHSHKPTDGDLFEK